MNLAIICGNLGSDPELNQTQSGTSVCNLSVAVNRKYKSDGELKEETTWFNVVVWGDQAENCDRFLSKGRQVLVRGRMQDSEWTDRDGVEHRDKELVAENVQFLSGDGAGGQGQPKQSPSEGNPAADGGSNDGDFFPGDDGDDEDPFGDDDIPF